ncbi:HAMP domain-containing sensor histidine kinase [Sedimentibacter sp.]|uniref:sensor histidine kinase n=1 Tax=Sedimentibacter sp. TaxID=1960295 RepID=UPI0028A73805|nr:HAMP domain-containing sensor histidine kinase [Sedimentibacter sp.]
MKSKISNQFFRNYLIVFLLSILTAVFVYLLSGFANDVISKTLVKNIYPASLLMKDDYTDIDTEPVVQNGGGVQVINDKHEVVFSEGLDTLGTKKLTVGEFTDFLVRSKEKGHQYSYDILYNPQGKFWLVITFPTSIRLDISFVYNKEAASKDIKNVSGAFIAIFILYLLMLGIFAVIFSRISSVSITKPLKMLLDGTKRLREGDYSARVNLNLKNEFADLQDTFNDMAQKIETETALREQTELERKRMIMDISHDLKNPLASVVGYTELCLQKSEESDKNLCDYLQIILKNSKRASHLLNGLFEFAKLESADYSIKLLKIDICECLRQTCADLLPILEKENFEYNFNIPEKSIYIMVDIVQMNRVLYNLTDNLIRYNPEGTNLTVSLYEEQDNAVILFKDNGIGIPSDIAKNIFDPFIRVDDSRNSQTGGTGLGLSIAYKIIKRHGGNMDIQTDLNEGCTFIITLPKV